MTESYKQKLQTDAYNLPYHYLDVMSEEYRLIWEIERISLMEILKQILSPFKGQQVLDAGCGDGRLCYELKNEKLKIVGVDFSEKAISFAKVFNPEIKFQITNLENITIHLGKFDQIVCQEMIEHILPSKVNLVLNNLNRLLKPNGKIIFTVPSKKIRMPMKHFQHFDEFSLKEVLKPYFIVKEIIGYNVVSYKSTLYLAGKYLISIFLPFRKKYRFIYALCEIIRKYYEANIAIGEPKNALGLIVICQKKS